MMAGMTDDVPRWHRPVYLPDLAGWAQADGIGPDAAHRTAAALVAGAVDVPGEAIAERLRDYLRAEGITELAVLWSQAPPVSLPGALYQLTLLREWVLGNREDVSRYYDAGRFPAEVHNVVAGVAEPPTPEAVVALVEQVLSSAFTGSLADALDRAASFCRVVSTGRVHVSDDTDTAQARLAAGNLTMADNLSKAASECRAGRLA
jgi:hypothetical protein